jgi:hypothetical protein
MQKKVVGMTLFQMLNLLIFATASNKSMDVRAKQRLCSVCQKRSIINNQSCHKRPFLRQIGELKIEIRFYSKTNMILLTKVTIGVSA